MTAKSTQPPAKAGAPKQKKPGFMMVRPPAEKSPYLTAKEAPAAKKPAKARARKS